MKKTFVLVFVMVAGALPAWSQTYGDFTDVEVVRVYDGDTFFVDISSIHPLLGDEIGIRVRGVDTPEIRAGCDQERELAYAARSLAETSLMEAMDVDLVNVERGKYFRIVATVMVDGTDLADILIDAELAVPYYGEGPKHEWCEESDPQTD